MTLEDYLYDGSRRLDMTAAPTTAGDAREQKSELNRRMEHNLERAAILQEELYASGEEGLVVAIQARDAAGKDSLIKKVFSALNPAALEVHSFKAPNSTELSHDYLWRIHCALPSRGKIGVFNRSQYEDVLVVKVHHLEQSYHIPQRCITEDFFEKRYEQLRNWEKYLYENGYRMIKLFLNVSQEMQKERFMERIKRNEKHWKLSTNDMKERADWDSYDRAYEDCINATGTPYAPWYASQLSGTGTGGSRPDSPGHGRTGHSGAGTGICSGSVTESTKVLLHAGEKGVYSQRGKAARTISEGE